MNTEREEEKTNIEQAAPVEFLVICSETKKHTTDAGTEYDITKWTCPICKTEKSALFIDDEICHGESHVTRFSNGEITAACFDCMDLFD